MSEAKISEARNLLAEAFGCDPEELLDGEVRAVRAVLALQSVRPQPAELANASVVEQIAQQWDGCQYDAPGEMVDIGAAIRRAGKRLSAELAEQQGDALANSRLVRQLSAMMALATEGDAYILHEAIAALSARQPGARDE